MPLKRLRSTLQCLRARVDRQRLGSPHRPNLHRLARRGNLHQAHNHQGAQVHVISLAASNLIPTGFDYNGVTVVGIAVLILILAAAGWIWFRPQVNRALKDKDILLEQMKFQLERERQNSDKFETAFQNSERARLEQGDQLDRLLGGFATVEAFIDGLRQAGSKSGRPEG